MLRDIIIIICFFGFAKHGYTQNSFSLAEAIRYGTEQSNEIKLKDLAISDASAQVKEIKAIGMPKVSANVNYQYYFAVPSQPVQDFLTPSIYSVLFEENVIPSRDLGTPQTFKFSLFQPNTLIGSIEASSLLFDGSYLYGMKAARFYRELVNQEKAVSAQKIKENVTKAYLSVLLADENLLVMKNNLASLEKSLNEVNAMFTNGFAESLDVDRLQLSRDKLSIEVENIEQLVAISKNILKFQMNYPMENEISLSQNINDLMVDWNNATELEKNGIDYVLREEYKMLQLGQQLNNLDYKRVQAGYYPVLRGFINAQASLFRKNLFDNDEIGWIPQSAAGVSLQIPIYDGGERSAKLQRIKIKNLETDIERENLENAIRLQVSNAYISYTNANKSLENRKKALNITNNIYNKTLIKFREGVGSSLEVTQAESDLYQAQGAYTESVYNVLSALLDWKVALGML